MAFAAGHAQARGRGKTGGSSAPPCQAGELLTQAKLLDDCAIPLHIRLSQIVQQVAPATHQLQQALAGVEVFFVLFEVPGQILNPGGQEGNLHFRRAGVAFVFGVFVNNVFFLSSVQYHSYLL